MPDLESRAMILDEANEIYYSVASIWEIMIKQLAQAKSEGMKFVTHDALNPYYNESFIISV